MQNKGALTFLALVLAIACAYQLSFTFVTRHVENQSVKYAAGNPEREQNYLDSMKAQTVYNLGFIKFNYKEVKEKEINLGLDLRGGMNIMLEVSLKDVVRALSNNSKDPLFNQAIEQAVEAQKNSTSDFITLFAQEYEKVSNGGRLSFIFNTPDLREYINPNSTNAEVIRILRDHAESAVANSYNVLRSRIDRFGVTQPNLQRLENGRILVELPGVKEPERVRKLLQGTASLEFWATYNNQEIYPMLLQANNVIRDINAAEAPAADTTLAQDISAAIAAAAVADNAPTTNIDRDALIREIEQMQSGLSPSMNGEEMAKQYPLLSKLSPLLDPMTGTPYGGPVVGQASSFDTAAVNRYLNMPQVKALLPRDIKLLWGVKAEDQAETVYALYAIRANTRDGRAPLDGGSVVDAREDYTQQGSSAEVSMTMNASGARTWARMTADNIGQSIAIVLDGYVYSAPTVQTEITGGSSKISGTFTIQEAKDLANVLKSGKLPAPASIIQEAVVGPSLGQESINASMTSFLLAFVLVLIYMIFFYSTAGVVASIALISNVFLLFGVLVSFGAVLTLPGIAGIVLTMGMAVDANVIIYERIKEELRAGKGLNLAIAEGYKNAMSAIIDSNVTSLITGIVLFIFGTGPVQGFATTLIIGILTSLFCAIFITRLIFTAMLSKNKKIRFASKITENFLSNTKVNFLKIRKYTYAVSIALILISTVSLFARSLNFGVDFTGGRAYVIRFDQVLTDDQVRDALEQGFAQAEGGEDVKSSEVKQFGPETQMQKRIVTQYMSDDPSQEASAQIANLLYESLGPLYAAPLTFDEFSTAATNPNGIIQEDLVGPSVASDITRNSFIAVFFSLFAIGIYILLRFKKWQWGMGSVIALAQDAFLTVGLFSLFWGLLPFNLEVNQSFIAAVLTIIGYSINDKVVIFDRIREYRTLYPKRNIYENINNAINSTLSRTINTSGTTLVTLLAIFLFGGEVIRGFVFALIFGIVVGTLSSIFTATPLAYDMMKKGEEGK